MLGKRFGFRFGGLLMGVVVLGIGLGPVDAHAKKKKKKAPTTIVMTGVKSFDKVFKQAKKANKKLRAAQSDLRDSKQALRSALKLSKKSTYVDGLKELKRRAKGKVRLYVNKGQLQLKASDAVPTDVKNGVEAVNRLTKTIPSSIRNLKSVTVESTKMFKKARKFPSNLRRELGSQGIDGLIDLVFKAPKITKKTVRNVRVISAMPKRAGKTSKELVQISSTIKDIF